MSRPRSAARTNLCFEGETAQQSAQKYRWSIAGKSTTAKLSIPCGLALLHFVIDMVSAEFKTICVGIAEIDDESDTSRRGFAKWLNLAAPAPG